jgi:4-hydroxy-tetrahydrodipicolinate synthase
MGNELSGEFLTMMKIPSVSGVVVATVLPFDETQAIDWPSFARLIEYCASPAGISAVFVNGHAGESAALTPAERTEVLRFARQHMPASLPLIAGVIAQSTAEAIAEARAAQAAGADMLTVFPPATGMVVEYVRAIAAQVDLPLIVFQYPLGSGFGYSTGTLAQLAELPSVVAVKEGSDSIRAYEENRRVLKAARPGFSILASNFDWFLAQLAIGSDGILSGLASVAPQLLVELWLAGERLDLEAMRAISATLQPLVQLIYAAPRNEMYVRIKFALHAMGVIASATARGPFLPVDAATAHAILGALPQAGLLAGGKKVAMP